MASQNNFYVFRRRREAELSGVDGKTSRQAGTLYGRRGRRRKNESKIYLCPGRCIKLQISIVSHSPRTEREAEANGKNFSFNNLNLSLLAQDARFCEGVSGPLLRNLCHVALMFLP